MYKLIVYGSLINEDELQNQGLWGHNVEPVKVFGFKRVFNQEPSYRMINSNNRAVLSIQPDNTAWFNAILIKDIDEAFFQALDMRESGYERIKTECKTYKGEFYKDCFVYMGKSEKHSETIAPNIEYMTLCADGAKKHGKEFYEDFLKTTFKNSKEGLVSIWRG